MLVMDKNKLSLHFIEMNRDLINNYRFIYAKDNNFSILSTEEKIFDFDFDNGLPLEFDKIGHVHLTWYNKIFSKYHKFLLGLFVIGILLIFIFLKKRLKLDRLNFSGRFFKKTMENGENDFEEIQHAIKALMEFKDQVFGVQILDQILKLDSILNTDYRRVKRSRLIRAVNNYYFSQNGNILIERIKSEEDRRIVSFKITV
jgi:hypothetical protein